MWLLHAAMQHAALLARVVMGRNPNASFTIQLGSFIFLSSKLTRLRQAVHGNREGEPKTP
jgi:hypothetical protein